MLRFCCDHLGPPDYVHPVPVGWGRISARGGTSHQGWLMSEANRKSAYIHEPGVCFYSLCENQSIIRLVDGCIKFLAEPKFLLGKAIKFKGRQRPWLV